LRISSTLGLPPLVQDGDVGADGDVPDAHVEEVLRLIGRGDLARGGTPILMAVSNTRRSTTRSSGE
jgi:hypothetical protein